MATRVSPRGLRQDLPDRGRDVGGLNGSKSTGSLCGHLGGSPVNAHRRRQASRGDALGLPIGTRHGVPFIDRSGEHASEESGDTPMAKTAISAQSVSPPSTCVKMQPSRSSKPLTAVFSIR